MTEEQIIKFLTVLVKSTEGENEECNMSVQNAVSISINRKN